MRTLLLFVFSCLLSPAVVIDRIAVVVNRHPIKTSDIDRELRVTDFLNNAKPNSEVAEKKAVEERLIDQQIIRTELSSGGYGRPSAGQAEALLGQIRRSRYGNSDARLRQALESYGLTEDQLRAQLLWQLTVLRFISDRFRTGVLVSDDDVQKYYEEHRASFQNAPLEKVSASIRTSLEGEQVTTEFEKWVADERKRADIDYQPAAAIHD
jgi:hypothetical protein